MPKKLNSATPSQKLVTRYGLVGKVTPELDEIIRPVAILDDLTAPESERFAALGDDRAAGGVGTFNTWELENEAGSGVDVYVTAIVTGCGVAACGWRINQQATAGVATGLSPRWRDLRLPGFPATRVRHGIPAVLIAGPFINYEEISTGRPWDLLQGNQIILGPGTIIGVQQEVANQQGSCQFFWFERNTAP